jgi:hypothetical protein
MGSGLQRAERELCPGLEVELAKRLVQVILDRVGADEELSSDLLVGLPECSQAGNL